MPRTWDVFLIDDEPVVRGAVRRVLEAEGLSVATADDAAQGLAHPAAVTCRAVLCDLMLPDGSGIDVIRSLKRRRPALPIVMITGYPTPGREALAVEAGAVGFLPKPFEPSELLRVVREVLELSEIATKENHSSQR